MLELNLAFQCHLWDVEHHALQSGNLLHQAAARRICQEILAALQCPLPMMQPRATWYYPLTTACCSWRGWGLNRHQTLVDLEV